MFFAVERILEIKPAKVISDPDLDPYQPIYFGNSVSTSVKWWQFPRRSATLSLSDFLITFSDIPQCFWLALILFPWPFTLSSNLSGVSTMHLSSKLPESRVNLWDSLILIATKCNHSYELHCICWQNKWIITDVSSNSENLLSDLIWVITKVFSHFRLRQFYTPLFHTLIFLSNVTYGLYCDDKLFDAKNVPVYIIIYMYISQRKHCLNTKC